MYVFADIFTFHDLWNQSIRKLTREMCMCVRVMYVCAAVPISILKAVFDARLRGLKMISFVNVFRKTAQPTSQIQSLFDVLDATKSRLVLGQYDLRFSVNLQTCQKHKFDFLLIDILRLLCFNSSRLINHGDYFRKLLMRDSNSLKSYLKFSIFRRFDVKELISFWNQSDQWLSVNLQKK